MDKSHISQSVVATFCTGHPFTGKGHSRKIIERGTKNKLPNYGINGKKLYSNTL